MADQQVIGALGSALVSGTPYTQLVLQEVLAQPLGAGQSIVIGYGTGTTQTVVVAAGGAEATAHTIPINSFNANANYPTNTPIGLAAGASAQYTRIEDGTSSQLLTVAQQHLGDNQVQPTSGGAALTSGPAQVTNLLTNASRLRETGADQQPSLGIQAGVTSLTQVFPSTSTSTIAAGATAPVVNLGVALPATNPAPARFVGGTAVIEQGTANEEYAYITAATSTTLTLAFPTGGAKFTHTAAPSYPIQVAVFNMERDFAGEGYISKGQGGAMAAEFETNSGGPALSTGIPSGLTLEADRNVQGKNWQQLAVTATVAGDKNLVFAANPSVGTPTLGGLVASMPIILSVGANGAAVEVVVVASSYVPAAGAGPITVPLVNPVVTSGSTMATFDVYGTGIPSTATDLGVGDAVIFVQDTTAADPKRGLKPLGGPAGVISIGGPVAAGAAVSGNPVRAGGSDGVNVQDLSVDTAGRQKVVGAAAAGAAIAGNPVLVAGSDGTLARPISTDTSGTVNVKSAIPLAANILDGFQTFTATAGATTLITIPAGRVWVGEVDVNVACAETAAGAVQAQATAQIATSGAGVTPAAGIIATVQAVAGVNSATGTVGTQGHASNKFSLVVVAPVGNAVTLTVTPTVAGTFGSVNVSALGLLQ